ncbi:MAG: hypothetical protein EOO05_16420, partial [Chitinophagaceae bacterium]
MNPIIRNSLSWKIGLLVASAALFTLSFVYNKLYSDRSSVAEEVISAEKYIHEQQSDFNRVLADTSLLRKLVESRETPGEFDRITAKRYGLFIYTVNNSGTLSMNFWSNQLAVPPENTYSMGDFEDFAKLANGYYLVVKRSMVIGPHTIMVYALIPVRSVFFLQTDYLPDQFVYSLDADKRVVISEKVTEFPVKSIAGKTLYYLDKKASGAVPYNSLLTIILRLGGLLLMLLFIHLIAESLAAKRVWKGVAFLGVTLLVLRVLIYLFPPVLNLRQFELFDPSIYGSSIIQQSLGDLMMNSALFCWIVLFTWFRIQRLEN